MQCPKCQATMQSVPVGAGVADRCSACHGLWFDLMEHEELKAYAGVVDTGDAEKGAEFNLIDRINCPVCPSSAMLRMVDADQPHIWFESCPTCYGRFYDAGEFRDFAEITLADVFRRFGTEARE